MNGARRVSTRHVSKVHDNNRIHEKHTVRATPGEGFAKKIPRVLGGFVAKRGGGSQKS